MYKSIKKFPQIVLLHEYRKNGPNGYRHSNDSSAVGPSEFERLQQAKDCGNFLRLLENSHKAWPEWIPTMTLQKKKTTMTLQNGKEAYITA